MGLFIFNRALISSRSAKDGASDIDLFAAPVQNLANVTSTEGLVTLYFKDGNSFTAFTGGTTNVRGYEYAQVELSVNVGDEQFVVRELGKLLSQIQKGQRTTITIDVPQETYSILGVTGINSIKRFNDLTTLTTDPSTGTGTSESAERIELEVRFDEAAAKGDPLYITGYNVGQARITVAKADASDSAKMPSIGLADAAYSLNDNGKALTMGSLVDVDTSSFSEGDVLYVAASGGLTATKPTGSNLIQNVGKVGRSNVNNGEIVVMAIGRSNDVPNLTTGKFFIGSASNSVESAYTLPTADGSANQILKTNGAGAVSFANEADTTYTAGDGLDLAGTEFSADLKANGGIVVESTELAVDLGASSITGTLDIGDGGTGQTTQQAALDAVTSASSGTTGQVLTTDGTNASWQDASGGGYKMLQTYSYSDTGTTDKFFVQNATTEVSGSNAARDYRSAFAVPVAGSIGDCTMMGGSAVNGNAYRLYVWIDNTSTYYSEATGGDLAGGRYTVRWTSWKNVSDDSDASDPSFSANAYLAFQLVPTGVLANPGSVSLAVLTSHT